MFRVINLVDLPLRETCTRKWITTFKQLRLLEDKQSLITPSLLTRDRWLSPERMNWKGCIRNTRWKFGSSEGVYDAAVSRIYEYLSPAVRIQHL